MGKYIVWKVERWLDHGFVLQKKYMAKKNSHRSNTYVTELKEAITKSKTNGGLHSSDVYEEEFRIRHISELESINKSEVQAKVMSHVPKGEIDGFTIDGDE